MQVGLELRGLSGIAQNRDHNIRYPAVPSSTAAVKRGPEPAKLHQKPTRNPTAACNTLCARRTVCAEHLPNCIFQDQSEVVNHLASTRTAAMVQLPQIVWAQRKDRILLTFDLQDTQQPDIKLENKGAGSNYIV